MSSLNSQIKQIDGFGNQLIYKDYIEESCKEQQLIKENIIKKPEVCDIYKIG